MKKNKTVLITFDVEEFDTALRHRIRLQMEQQMKVSQEGLLNIVAMLEEVKNPPCTFYTTANYALHFPETIKKIAENHEIASHTFNHSTFKPIDILESKICLEKIIGKEIHGFRMPNMAPFDKSLIKKAGYKYDSSINPTYLPGKYNHLKYSTKPFIYHDVLEIPCSVLPVFRLPLFWLTFKNLPLSIFIFLCNLTLFKTGFLNLYFHPWEFADLDSYKIPNFIIQPNGNDLTLKLKKLIEYYQKKPSVKFATTYDYYKQITLYFFH